MRILITLLAFVIFYNLILQAAPLRRDDIPKNTTVLPSKITSYLYQEKLSYYDNIISGAKDRIKKLSQDPKQKVWVGVNQNSIKSAEQSKNKLKEEYEKSPKDTLTKIYNTKKYDLTNAIRGIESRLKQNSGNSLSKDYKQKLQEDLTRYKKDLTTLEDTYKKDIDTIDKNNKTTKNNTLISKFPKGVIGYRFVDGKQVPIEKSKIDTNNVLKKFQAFKNNQNTSSTNQKSTTNTLEELKKKRAQLLQTKQTSNNQSDLSKKIQETIKKGTVTKNTPKVSTPTPIKKPQGKTIQSVFLKKPVTIKTLPLPTSSTTTKFKTFGAEPKKVTVSGDDKKTIIKNSTLSTTTKVGNIDTKGKLNISNINVSKGAEITNSNIITNVKAKDISVSKTGNSDIGSVNIEK